MTTMQPITQILICEENDQTGKLTRKRLILIIIKRHQALSMPAIYGILHLQLMSCRKVIGVE
jgi:hypothetical protein